MGAVIMLKVLKKGDKDIDKVTNADRPNRLGRKRANKIRSFFNLDKKNDDVRTYVIHSKIEKKIKADRVNRWKTTKEQKQKYEKLISQFVKEKKAAQHAEKKAAEEAKAAAAKK